MSTVRSTGRDSSSRQTWSARTRCWRPLWPTGASRTRPRARLSVSTTSRRTRCSARWGRPVFFSETTPYAPNSPYSASKAGSDHLVRAWHETFGLPTVLTNCSNNYGPYIFPEKLIPLVIIRALAGESLPVYGKGDQIRDWLYVEDHAEALRLVLEKGVIGESYNIGGWNERQNIEVVERICDLLDTMAPSPTGLHRRLITFVADRPGHDVRYAIDATKIERELGWKPRETFETGLEKTVRWFLDNRQWWQDILNRGYEAKRVGVGR